MPIPKAVKKNNNKRKKKNTSKSTASRKYANSLQTIQKKAIPKKGTRPKMTTTKPRKKRRFEHIEDTMTNSFKENSTSTKKTQVRFDFILLLFLFLSSFLD